jgi:hypothetical protein
MSVIDNDRPVSAYTEPVSDYSERKEQVRQAVRRYRRRRQHGIYRRPIDVTDAHQAKKFLAQWESEHITVVARSDREDRSVRKDGCGIKRSHTRASKMAPCYLQCGSSDPGIACSASMISCASRRRTKSPPAMRAVPPISMRGTTIRPCSRSNSPPSQYAA